MRNRRDTRHEGDLRDGREQTDDAEAAFEFEHAHPWGGPITLRGKLRRGGIAALAVVLALALIFTVNLGGIRQTAGDLVGGLLPAHATHYPIISTITTPPPQRAAGSSWDQISVPVVSPRASDLVPSPNDPATVYICAGADYRFGQAVIPGTFELWVTHNSGRSWNRIGLPGSAAVGCQVAVARDNPRRVAVTAEAALADGQVPCAEDTLYVSDDGGDSWLTVPHSFAPIAGQTESCRLTVTARHLYLWYETPGPSVGGVRTRQTALQRSDDGRSWVRADAGLPAGEFLLPPSNASGDTLLVTSLLSLDPLISASLWQSSDAGKSWRQVSKLPPGDERAYAAKGPTPASGPFYAVSNDQIPHALYRLRIDELLGTHPWAATQPLPVSGTDGIRAGIAQVVGETSAGQLLVLGVGPRAGLAPEPAPTRDLQWLWAWNPRTASWSNVSSELPTPWPDRCSAQCWETGLTQGALGGKQTTYVWARACCDAQNALVYRAAIPGV